MIRKVASAIWLRLKRLLRIRQDITISAGSAVGVAGTLGASVTVGRKRPDETATLEEKVAHLLAQEDRQFERIE